MDVVQDPASASEQHGQLDQGKLGVQLDIHLTARLWV